MSSAICTHPGSNPCVGPGAGCLTSASLAFGRTLIRPVSWVSGRIMQENGGRCSVPDKSSTPPGEIYRERSLWNPDTILLGCVSLSDQFLENKSCVSSTRLPSAWHTAGVPYVCAELNRTRGGRRQAVSYG